MAGAAAAGPSDRLVRPASRPAAGPAGRTGPGRPGGSAMTWLDLVALMPVLILVFGATTLLMVGAWYHQPRPLMAAGLAVALTAALVAGLAPPDLPDIAGMFSCTPYARFFTILWAIGAALVLMLSLRYA